MKTTKNFNTNDINENARYNVTITDPEDATYRKTCEMTGNELKSYTYACGIYYNIHAEEVAEEVAEEKHFENTMYQHTVENNPTYSDMIKFCCDSLILNNSIMETLMGMDFYFDEYCGTTYDDETDEYTDIYQWYIIDEHGAERLARYTNEIVFYNENLDLYLLGVTHCGTAWNDVAANWKTVESYREHIC